MAEPTIIHLPPQPVPPALSAQARATTLAEHLQGFLAANNLRGFVQDLPGVADPDSIACQLQQLLEQDEIHRDRLRSTAWAIKRKAGKAISYCQWLEIIAAMLGYRSWAAIGTRATDQVPNLGSAVHVQERMFSPERTDTLRQAKRAVLRPRQPRLQGEGSAHG